jgi:hypothetical protein
MARVWLDCRRGVVLGAWRGDEPRNLHTAWLTHHCFDERFGRDLMRAEEPLPSFSITLNPEQEEHRAEEPLPTRGRDPKP